MLLEKGVDTEMSLNMGEMNNIGYATPLYAASKCGHAEVVKHLLDRGANATRHYNGGGGTALWIASKEGHAEVARLLLDHGAAVNRNNGQSFPLLRGEQTSTRLIVKD